jgi:hypothetical protein
VDVLEPDEEPTELEPSEPGPAAKSAAPKPVEAVRTVDFRQRPEPSEPSPAAKSRSAAAIEVARTVRDLRTRVASEGGGHASEGGKYGHQLEPPLVVELLWLPTLLPDDSLETLSVAETVVLSPRALRARPPAPAPRRTWLFAVPFLGGFTLGGASALVLLCGGTALFVLLAVAGLLVQRPGGAERLVGEGLNLVRQEFPSLIVPIEELEVRVQHVTYEATRWWAGAPAQEPTFALPPELVAGPSDLPAQVSFDPAQLSLPLMFFPAQDGPDWMTVSRPVLDPAFPDDLALVLKFDMRRAELHWMPGRKDPWPMAQHEMLADAVPAPDRSGRVPMALRRGPLVAFGGGFQSLHFPSFGARWQGHDIIRMRSGIQTVAIYEDGHVDIGPWGTLPAKGIAHARQNLPPLVHEGKIPANIAYLNVGTMSAKPLDPLEPSEPGPAAKSAAPEPVEAVRTVDFRQRVASEGGDGASEGGDGASEGGKHSVRTYTNVHTWRSALGVREDGDLVYVLAARVTPQQLAATLIRAGAVEGMQLDINAAWHASPTLCAPHPDARRYSDIDTRPLFPGVEDGGRRFVSGSERDFFFLVQRP